MPTVAGNSGKPFVTFCIGGGREKNWHSGRASESNAVFLTKYGRPFESGATAVTK